MPRKFPRKELVGKATITTESQKFMIHVTDISCDGMSVMEINEGDFSTLDVKQSVKVSMILNQKRIEFDAIVMWKNPLGAGITIEQIDEENFKGWLRILNIAFKS